MSDGATEMKRDECGGEAGKGVPFGECIAAAAAWPANPAPLTATEVLRRNAEFFENLQDLGSKRDPHYASLHEVLMRAYSQAAVGKGALRHGQDLPFESQPMQTISRLVGSHDGLLYQAIKKTQESQRMDKDAAVRELLGAINYLAGAIIYLESRNG